MTMQQYKVEVEVYGEPRDSWHGNALRFSTMKDALEYGISLVYRWSGVRRWRVVGVKDGDSNKTK